MNEKTGDKLKNTGVENFIPRTIQRAIRTSLEVLTAALALPEARIDAATEAACRALAGRDTEPDGDGQRLNGIVTIREAAKLLHRSTKTISEMVKRGVFTGIRGGSAKQRTTGIVRSSLMRYLDGFADERGGGAMNDVKEELELAINELKWVVRDLTDAADKKISDRRRAVAEMRSRCRVCRNEAERVLTALAITIKLLAEQRIEEGGK